MNEQHVNQAGAVEASKGAVRILVVDDEPGARSALTELLREEGYDVHSAADGYKALGRLDGWEPDLVITDLKMPGMDGVELMKKIRERVIDVGVVVMTAFGSVVPIHIAQNWLRGPVVNPAPIV